MATLSGNINASQRNIRVADGEAVTPSLRLRVDDELIDFIRFEPYPYINGLRQKGLDPTRWVVTRGVGDSVAISHLSGATLTAAVEASVSSETLTPPAPFAGEGGGAGVTVDNQSDPPAEVTTLIAPGADVSTPGEATLVTEQAIFSATVILTHAQIITLPSTPVTLIPAAGAGKIIHLIGISVVADVDAGVYTNMDTETMVYGVLDPAISFNSASIPVAGEDLLGSVSNRTAFLLSNITVSPPDPVITRAVFHSAAAAINTPIALGCDNPNGVPGVDLTGGNAANTLKATALYVVLDA